MVCTIIYITYNYIIIYGVSFLYEYWYFNTSKWIAIKRHIQNERNCFIKKGLHLHDFPNHREWKVK